MLLSRNRFLDRSEGVELYLLPFGIICDVVGMAFCWEILGARLDSDIILKLTWGEAEVVFYNAVVYGSNRMF